MSERPAIYRIGNILYAQFGKPMRIDCDSAPTYASANASADEDAAAPRPYRCLSILLLEQDAGRMTAEEARKFTSRWPKGPPDSVEES